ncbi:hypothetical protein FGIG_08714 [Fasciola gigantica]|uniref:Uncharacterized protein n=1 Tax=Fasciola gigantica TaxID=46835 RepID=A0A504Z257_FASGI|nr:hypothetical protein FGIG_08714 [Fasciola gigantica]
MSGDEQIATTVAPAVKVGGMRIAKHVKEPEEKPLTRSELMKQAEEYNSEIASVPQHSMVTREERDFHDRTVKSQQDKPKPTVTKSHVDSSVRIIQQPLK